MEGTAAAGSDTGPQPGDHGAAVLALQVRVAALDATAAADVQLLAAVHEVEQLLEIVKDRTIRAVQDADVTNEVIGAALGVTRQAISKRWPRPRPAAETEDAKESDGTDGGEGAGGRVRPKSARARSRGGDEPWTERLAVRLPGVRCMPTLHLQVTHRPVGRPGSGSEGRAE